MSLDDSGLPIAEQATRALGSLERYGHVLRPTGADETAWRLEMLEELTRAGHRLPRGVRPHRRGRGPAGRLDGPRAAVGDRRALRARRPGRPRPARCAVPPDGVRG